MTARNLLLVAPYAVSLGYVAVLFALQPPDRLGSATGAHRLSLVLYDDQDVTAMAQRGLNAHRGRSAGLAQQPLNRSDADFESALDHPPPLAERTFLEYPHASVWFFRLPFDAMRPDSPNAVLDGGIGEVHWHVPRNERERAFWTQLRLAVRSYELAMLLALWGLIALMQLGLSRDGTLTSLGLLLVLPCGLYFGISRFDLLPALLMAASLAALGRGWLATSGGLLAIGAACKLAPGLLAPLILCYLGRKGALRWLVGAVGVGLAILAVQLASEDVTALLAPYRFQASREPYGPSIYGFLLPPILAEQNLAGKILRHGGLLLLIVALCWRPIASLAELLRRGAVLLIGFVLLQVIFSPQWILWFYPLILPLVRRQPVLGVLLAALDVSTYLLWPVSGVLGWGWWENVALQDVRLAAQLGLCYFLLTGSNHDRAIAADSSESPAN